MSSTGAQIQWGVVVVIVGALLLSGPLGGIDFVSGQPSLDSGNATVEVVAPQDGRIPVTDGRFGTGVSYVRIPDLVVDVGHVEGTPRVSYVFAIAELGIEKRNTRLVDSTGRLTVPLGDRALPNPTPSIDTEARIIVRVQSYSGQYTVWNRTMEVRSN